MFFSTRSKNSLSQILLKFCEKMFFLDSSIKILCTNFEQILSQILLKFYEKMFVFSRLVYKKICTNFEQILSQILLKFCEKMFLFDSSIKHFAQILREDVFSRLVYKTFRTNFVANFVAKFDSSTSSRKFLEINKLQSLIIKDSTFCECKYLSQNDKENNNERVIIFM